MSEVVPIWAQIYEPANNKVRDADWENIKNRPEFRSVNLQPSKPIEKPKSADIEPTASSEALPSIMPPSISNLLPIDDLCKVIASWVYNNAENLDSNALEHIEVEFKLGLISNEGSRMRHKFPGLSECVVDPNYWSYSKLTFKSDVDPQDFKQAEQLLNSIVQTESNEIEFVSKLIRDDIYQAELKLPGLPAHGKVRVSSDDLGQVHELIFKQRIGDLYISAPNAKYDIKMTMSVEHPFPKERLNELPPNQKVYERNKNRLSWVTSGCRADLTAVNSETSSGQLSQTKEIELEADSKVISSALINARQNSSSLDTFFEVLRYTIDSARYITRNL